MSDQTATENKTVSIVYYTDPLCCWSWGFEKHRLSLDQTYRGQLQWRYCMGGLLPDWKHFQDNIYQVSRPAQMGPVWVEASHLTDTEIRSRIWIEDPPASSYLSCIAVKCAALQSPAAEECYLLRLRTAVMLEGRNISYASQLIEIARELSLEPTAGLDLDLFIHDLENSRGMEAFRKDLNEVQRLNISRFPTFILKSAHHPALIITGYRSYEMFAQAIETMRGA